MQRSKQFELPGKISSIDRTVVYACEPWVGAMLEWAVRVSRVGCRRRKMGCAGSSWGWEACSSPISARPLSSTLELVMYIRKTPKDFQLYDLQSTPHISSSSGLLISSNPYFEFEICSTFQAEHRAPNTLPATLLNLQVQASLPPSSRIMLTLRAMFGKVSCIYPGHTRLSCWRQSKDRGSNAFVPATFSQSFNQPYTAAVPGYYSTIPRASYTPNVYTDEYLGEGLHVFSDFSTETVFHTRKQHVKEEHNPEHNQWGIEEGSSSDT